MVFWLFGKIWKNKNHTGFIRLGSERKGWFSRGFSFWGMHFFEYEQRPYDFTTFTTLRLLIDLETHFCTLNPVSRSITSRKVVKVVKS